MRRARRFGLICSFARRRAALSRRAGKTVPFDKTARRDKTVAL